MRSTILDNWAYTTTVDISGTREYAAVVVGNNVAPNMLRACYAVEVHTPISWGKDQQRIAWTSAKDTIN